MNMMLNPHFCLRKIRLIGCALLVALKLAVYAQRLLAFSLSQLRIALFTAKDVPTAGKTCMMRRAAEALKLDQNVELDEVVTI